MKDWEIIADNLGKSGFSWGYVSIVDSDGRTIWIADAHRDDGKRFQSCRRSPRFWQIVVVVSCVSARATFTGQMWLQRAAKPPSTNARQAVPEYQYKCRLGGNPPSEPQLCVFELAVSLQPRLLVGFCTLSLGPGKIAGSYSKS
jgi:hypothetical protein